MAGVNGAAAFLGPTRLAGYQPRVVNTLYNRTTGQWRGPWGLRDIEEMRREPKVQIGLWCIYSPLHSLEWEVTADDPAVADYVNTQLRKFWDADLIKALPFVEYGNSAGEVQYDLSPKTGRVEYQGLRDVCAADARPLEYPDEPGKCVGVRIAGRDDILTPRSWWLAHEPRFGSLYGVSRLWGAWEPWKELTGRHGAKDLRRHWYVKDVTDGGLLRYPDGTTTDSAGLVRNNKDIADEILEKKLAGGTLAMPVAMDPVTKEFLWQYTPPSYREGGSDVREYVKDMNLEILDGLRVPPEVLQAADGTGLSQGGRTIPLQLYWAGEDMLALAVIAAWKQCIGDPLVAVNFGPGREYTVKPKSLAPWAGQPPPQPGQGRGPGGRFGAKPPPEPQPPQPQAPPPPVSMALKDKGRWVTIGGVKGEDGKRHGGSPVFIQNGRIVKGHPSLTGKRIEALDEEGEHGTARQQLHQSRQYARAGHARAARQEGIDPKHLHQLAADYLAHDREFVAEKTRMLQEARKIARGLGVNLDTVKARAAHGDLDWTKVGRLDEVAKSLRHQGYPGFSGEPEDLFDLLLRGNPEPMSEDDAYEQALEHLRQYRPATADPTDFNFGALALGLRDGVHAPAGGVTVGGKHYAGGEYIPGAALAAAPKAERAQLVEAVKTERRAGRKTARKAGRARRAAGHARRLRREAGQLAAQAHPAHGEALRHAGRALSAAVEATSDAAVKAALRGARAAGNAAAKAVRPHLEAALAGAGERAAEKHGKAVGRQVKKTLGALAREAAGQLGGQVESAVQDAATPGHSRGPKGIRQDAREALAALANPGAFRAALTDGGLDLEPGPHNALVEELATDLGDAIDTGRLAALADRGAPPERLRAALREATGADVEVPGAADGWDYFNADAVGEAVAAHNRKIAGDVLADVRQALLGEKANA